MDVGVESNSARRGWDGGPGYIEAFSLVTEMWEGTGSVVIEREVEWEWGRSCGWGW